MTEDTENTSLSRRNMLAMTASAAAVTVAGSVSAALADKTVAQLPAVDTTRRIPENLSQALLRELTLKEKVEDRVPPNGAGQILEYEGHTYTCLSSLDDRKTNARGYALLDITPQPGNATASKAEPQELLLLFPGLTYTPASDATAIAIIEGKRSPQSAVIAEYMQRDVLPYLQQHPQLHVSILGHSMGAGNAIRAKHMADMVSSHVKATLIEPFAAGLEATYIARNIQRATPDAGAVEDALNQLRRNITSIRANPRTLVSKLRVGESLTNNKQFGDNVFVLNANPGQPLTREPPIVSPKKVALAGAAAAGVVLVDRSASDKPFSRRTFFKAAGTLAVPPAGAAVGIAASERFNETYHKAAYCADLLRTAGDGSLIPGNTSVLLASNDEVLHPERYPTSRTDSFAERVSEGYMELSRLR
jgi:hypothetical protein